MTCLLTGTLFLFWQQRKDYDYDKAEFSVHLKTVLPTPLEVSEDCTAVYHLHTYTQLLPLTQDSPVLCYDAGQRTLSKYLSPSLLE